MPGSTLSIVCSSSFKSHKNSRCTSISFSHMKKPKPTKVKYTVKVSQLVVAKLGCKCR